MSDPRMAVRVEDISFGYRRRAPLFEDFSLEVPGGAITALTGSSGCGKSTLMYIMAGLLTPSRGRVYVGDIDILQLPDSERSLFRARHLGFVFQDFVLDPRHTLLEAIVEPCVYAHVPSVDYVERARHLLTRFGVVAPETATPMELSRGQAQRVALARATLLEPQVVLADEPTGNLDSESATKIMAALREQADLGTTVVVVTHDERVTTQADHVIRVDHVA